MSLADEIEELSVIQNNTEEEQRKRKPKEHPKGWERGVTIEGGKGYAYTGLTEIKPKGSDWDAIIEEFGLDPEEYEIDPDATLDLRVWDMPIGDGVVRRMHYYRAPVRLKDRHVFISEAEFSEGLKAFKPPRKEVREAVYDDPNGFVVCLADWQIGKCEVDSGGTTAIRDRIMASTYAALDRLKQLRRIGVVIETVYIVGMGDMIEACDGHYASQTARTDLNERQQFRLASRLFRNTVALFAKEAQKVVVTSVGGNHGENRKNGKLFTDPGDNKDTMLVEITADRFSENSEAFGHVSFVGLENKLWATLDIYGTSVGFSHGHLAKSGATAEAKQRKWLSDQAIGLNDIGDVELFVTAHYHHFCVSDWGPRMWIQCPTQDGGSEWWENTKGQRSTAGTLTFVCGPVSKTHADFIKVV